jgi:hypothetical protein
MLFEMAPALCGAYGVAPRGSAVAVAVEIKVRDDGLWTKVDSITAFDGLTIVVWRQPHHATGV